MTVNNSELIKQLDYVARPLIKWLNNNCSTHSTIIIETDKVEVLSGNVTLKIEYKHEDVS